MSALKTTVRPALRIVARERLRPVAVLRRLLAPAGDDEERVVDREAETEARDEVEREDRERMHLDRDPQPEEREPDCARADERRQERGHEAAEDPEREQQDERERDQLGAAEVALDRVRHLAGRDRAAAETHAADRRRTPPMRRSAASFVASPPRRRRKPSTTPFSVDDRPRDGRIAVDPRPHPLDRRRPARDEDERRRGRPRRPYGARPRRFASRLSEERSANWVAPASMRGITVLPSAKATATRTADTSVTARAGS